MRGVNRGMQIPRSGLFVGSIRRSDDIFAKIRILITEKLSVFKFTTFGYIYLSVFPSKVFRHTRSVEPNKLKRN